LPDKILLWYTSAGYYLRGRQVLLADFGLVALFLIIAIGFAAFTLILPFILRFLRIVPRKSNAVKSSTYECGMETIGTSWVQFNFRYYFYALIFVALDVLVLFLYPWAVGLRDLGTFSLIGVTALILIVVIGYIYAWRRKVLEWK
jgi:NADH-quinone oxidoreductase subunit A